MFCLAAPYGAYVGVQPAVVLSLAALGLLLLFVISVLLVVWSVKSKRLKA